jgi:hypothetical protein
VSFAARTLCVASQRVFIVVSVCFFIDSVRKLLDTPSYVPVHEDKRSEVDHSYTHSNGAFLIRAFNSV